MTIKLVNVIEHYSATKAQYEAVEYLQTQLEARPTILAEFTRLWRREDDTTSSEPEVGYWEELFEGLSKAISTIDRTRGTNFKKYGRLLLRALDDYGISKTIPAQAAYILATASHESLFAPVEEGYYLGAKAKEFQRGLRYYPYYGRGFVQLTWKYNYQWATKALNKAKLGGRDDWDLVNDLDQALDPHAAAYIMIKGMMEGHFGARLDKYINRVRQDYYNARRSVNILDKAKLIAGYAEWYEKKIKELS